MISSLFSVKTPARLLLRGIPRSAVYLKCINWPWIRSGRLVCTSRTFKSSAVTNTQINMTTENSGLPALELRYVHHPPKNIFALNPDVKFRLHDSFVASYRNKDPPFGFNGLGEFVYRRTYSRLKPDGENEKWWETVERVVNGTFSIQKRWMISNHLGWDESQNIALAERMYDKVFNFKFLPPGRGLWAMGSPLTEERGLFAALNNCAFVSTEHMWDAGNRVSDPFLFLMDASMLGVGVGFDTKGANSSNPKAIVKRPDGSGKKLIYRIEDSREGWVDSLAWVIESYFDPTVPTVEFDYSLVRPAGQPIRGFGGIASGPGTLKDLHEHVRQVLNDNIGKPLTVTSIVDLMNLIGKCVVSGNVRRTAEIAFGEANDEEYINLKNYEINPHRAEYGWTSNNSVYCHTGMDYGNAVKRVVDNGEPGFFWLDNARKFGRMIDPPNNKDYRAGGGNPCLEQTLESYELCCLVETFPHNHSSYSEFQETLESAFLYAKTVTLTSTHWEKCNRVMMRNRRVGTSLSGVTQFVSDRGLNEFVRWCDHGYKFIQEADQRLSEHFAIPRSIKTTSVKPSGTVSLLAGATPGLHFPESPYVIRRIRLSNQSPLIQPLKAANLKIEPAVGSEATTSVVEFPMFYGDKVRGLDDVSMWEQLELAAVLQAWWSDNQVSCTVTFDPEKEGALIDRALEYFQFRLKGISFLPRSRTSAPPFPQMPYEAITKSQYLSLVDSINADKVVDKDGVVGFKIHFDSNNGKTKSSRDGDDKDESIRLGDPEMERWCDGDTCVL